MNPTQDLNVVIIKASKYDADGYVERFRWGFMPNATIPYMRSLTPAQIRDCRIHVFVADEYVQTNLDYLRFLHNSSYPTLLALVGVQSHQFQRAIDLGNYALARGTDHVVIGGPHPMTCDTSLLHGRGISFALSEAERVWPTILNDAIAGQLQPVYGEDQRWATELDPPPLAPPPANELKRYVIPMMGIYPARGCPYTCNFCSVIKIAGQNIRSQPVATTLASLRAAKKAGVSLVMFSSDNFNKYPDRLELLQSMIDDKTARIPFFVQCDTMIAKDESLVDMLGRAGCFQMFVGVESFDRKILLGVHKTQNHPKTYGDIVRLCRENRISPHFSNIIGFPMQTADDIRGHVETLSSFDPDIASFYILTPIPGTEQYKEFKAGGLITEPNLDRYDGTCSTWHHTSLSRDELQNLEFDCYKRFYTGKKIARDISRGVKTLRFYPELLQAFSVSAFSRYSAHKRRHPMSGGIWRVRLDNSREYSQLRKDRFDLDLVPLPDNLELSQADAALNNRVKL